MFHLVSHKEKKTLPFKENKTNYAPNTHYVERYEGDYIGAIRKSWEKAKKSSRRD